MANTSIRYDLKLGSINAAVERAFSRFAEEYGEYLNSFLTEPVRPYPRETVRENGEVVGSPRDVVDTGELVESFEAEVVTAGGGFFGRLFGRGASAAIEFKWNAAHAEFVYMGWNAEGNKPVPPYPWVAIAEAQQPPQEFFARILREEVSRG